MFVGLFIIIEFQPVGAVILNFPILMHFHACHTTNPGSVYRAINQYDLPPGLHFHEKTLVY